MTNHLFKAVFGRVEINLGDLLLKVHDAAPNSDKRAWRLLLKAKEDALHQQTDPIVPLLADALEDAARGQPPSS